MKTYIYILQDPRNNLVKYVGKSNNPRRRYTSHLVYTPKNKSHCHRWIQSLKKKGLKPIMTVIDEITGDWEWLEQYWIEQFKHWGFNLVNLTVGGEGVVGYIHKKETIEKLSEKITCICPNGIKHTCNCKEIALKIGVSHGAIYNVLYKSTTGKVKGWHSFKMLNPNQKYLSNLEIIKQNKPKISDLCKKISSENCKKLFSKPIIQYNKNMVIISEYPSLSEASRQTGINTQNISAVCLGKNKTAGGFKWEYKKLIEIVESKSE